MYRFFIKSFFVKDYNKKVIASTYKEIVELYNICCSITDKSVLLKINFWISEPEAYMREEGKLE